MLSLPGTKPRTFLPISAFWFSIHINFIITVVLRVCRQQRYFAFLCMQNISVHAGFYGYRRSKVKGYFINRKRFCICLPMSPTSYLSPIWIFDIYDMQILLSRTVEGHRKSQFRCQFNVSWWFRVFSRHTKADIKRISCIAATGTERETRFRSLRYGSHSVTISALKYFQTAPPRIYA